MSRSACDGSCFGQATPHPKNIENNPMQSRGIIIPLLCMGLFSIFLGWGVAWPKQDPSQADLDIGDHTTGLTPGSAVTRSRNLAPRISKLRYWSNEAQAGDSNTTGSGSPDASASRAALATATSSVCEISCGTLVPSVPANSCAASPIR